MRGECTAGTYVHGSLSVHVSACVQTLAALKDTCNPIVRTLFSLASMCEGEVKKHEVN